MKNYLLPALILLFSLTSCGKTSNAASTQPLALASFTENSVTVSVQLDKTPEGVQILSATFTPLKDHHLYSKDIPPTGVNGLGRPTLLELTEDSRMKQIGEVTESAQAEKLTPELQGLLVYPVGAVTLSMQVELPPGTDWVDDTVKISFMACSDIGCKPPVVGKIVTVHIPGAEARQ